jgi:hypothetical protein
MFGILLKPKQPLLSEVFSHQRFTDGTRAAPSIAPERVKSDPARTN